MRRLLRFTFLLAVVSPVAAQTERPPADAARLDRVLDALDLGGMASGALAGMANDPRMAEVIGEVPPDVVRAAVRARLADGYSRERADALLTDTSAVAAFVGRMTELQDPSMLAPAVQAMITPPKKGVLADSAEAARFVRASGVPEFTRRLFLDVIEGAAAASEAARADIARSGLSMDELVDNQMESLMEFVGIVDRLAPQTPQRRRAVAFAESDAGQWAIESAFAGFRVVYAPVLVNALLASFEAQQSGR